MSTFPSKIVHELGSNVHTFSHVCCPTAKHKIHSEGWSGLGGVNVNELHAAPDLPRGTALSYVERLQGLRDDDVKGMFALCIEQIRAEVAKVYCCYHYHNFTATTTATATPQQLRNDV